MSSFVMEDGKAVEVTVTKREVKYTEHWVSAVDHSFQRMALPEEIYATKEAAKNANSNRRRV